MGVVARPAKAPSCNEAGMPRPSPRSHGEGAATDLGRLGAKPLGRRGIDDLALHHDLHHVRPLFDQPNILLNQHTTATLERDY